MAQQGTNLNQPLYIQAPLPIDGRLIVDTVEGVGDSLVSLIVSNNYPNMYVWVRSEKSFYYLIDSPPGGGELVTDWAQASGGVGATGCAKSGYVPGTSFTGLTASANVTFSSPYQSASYSVVVTGEQSVPEYIYSVTNKTITGFTIVVDVNATLEPFGATAMWITNCWDGSGLFNGVGGGGASIAIDLSEVAFGTGTSITSSNVFTFDNTTNNLIVSKNASMLNNGQSAIITGQKNSIENSDASIITGSFNEIYDSYKSAIIGGGGNAIGTQSRVEKALASPRNNNNVIIGGGSNQIIGVSSCHSSIIGGASSSISESQRSVILGGFGLTLSNVSSVVYVPKLKIATASNDESSTKVLVWGTDNYVGYKDASGLGGNAAFLPLPIPKINLMQDNQEVEVYDSVGNTISATAAVIQNYPVLINMDFTSDHFSNPNNRIFIEMVHYKRKSSGKKNGPLGGRTPNGKSYAIPAKNIANVGQDEVDLPWLQIPGTGGFWSRGGASSWYDSSLSTSFPIGINRPNHYEVNSYTMSSYPIWEYLNGRFEFYNVNYRDTTGATSSIETLIPSTGKSRAGRNRPTGRFAYSPYYTPYYCAFRYIQWIPTANGGKGQIVSGPLSRVIKVTGLNFPFQVDYQQSAILGFPVCDISTQWTLHPVDSYRRLKCDWESNLP